MPDNDSILGYQRKQPDGRGYAFKPTWRFVVGLAVGISLPLAVGFLAAFFISLTPFDDASIYTPIANGLMSLSALALIMFSFVHWRTTRMLAGSVGIGIGGLLSVVNALAW